MRLITLTLLVLAVLLLLILLFPVLFLEATAPILQDPYQQTTGNVLAGGSMMIARPMTAAEVYEFLSTRNPDSSDLYRLKSDALLKGGDEKGALLSLDAALSRDPQNPVLLVKKARLLVITGKRAEAEPLYSTILLIQTDNPRFLSVIADIALENNQYLDALNRYTRLLNINPGDGLTWEKRSDVVFALLTIPTAGTNASESLKKKDLYTEGITGYQKALTLIPDRATSIRTKITKRSQEYIPRTIQELEERYRQYRYLNPGEQPLPP